MQQNFYKYAIENVTSLVVTDTNGTITSVNEKFCQLTGYQQEELIGNTHRLVNSGYHDKEFFREMWETISQGKTWTGEICNRNKAGKIYWASTVIVPQLDNDNKPCAYHAFRTDVSARKEIEKLLDRIADNIPVVVYVMDANTTETYFTTRAIYHFLGYTKEEIISGGPTFTNTLFHPDDLPLLTKMLHQTCQLKDGENNIIQYRIKHKKGGYHWFESNEMVLERDKQGNASKILGFAQNITEKIEHIEMLKEQNRRLEEIAKLNAHAIRGPVATLLGLIELLHLQKNGKDNTNYGDIIEYLKQTGEKLDKVIHQVNEQTNLVDKLTRDAR